MSTGKANLRTPSLADKAQGLLAESRSGSTTNSPGMGLRTVRCPVQEHMHYLNIFLFKVVPIRTKSVSNQISFTRGYSYMGHPYREVLLYKLSRTLLG